MTTESSRLAGSSLGILVAFGLLLASCGSSQSVDSSGGVVSDPTASLAPVLTDGSDGGQMPADIGIDAPPESMAATGTTELSAQLATSVPLLCSASSTTWDILGHEVLVRIPDTTTPVALIVALHGYKGTPEGLEYYSELTAASEGGEAVVAYLPGGTVLDLGFGWNSGSSRFATTSGDDVAYIATALEQLVSLPCVDPSNVSLVGESNGGGMAVRATCDERLAGRVQRLVLVNAAIDDGVLAGCSALAQPVEVLATVGLVDAVVPPDGSRPPFLAVDNWLPRVATAVGGCDSVAPLDEPGSAMVTTLVGEGCGRCVTMFEVTDGGHTWPGSIEGVNGQAVGSLEFTEMLRSRVREGPAEQDRLSQDFPAAGGS